MELIIGIYVAIHMCIGVKLGIKHIKKCYLCQWEGTPFRVGMLFMFMIFWPIVKKLPVDE